MEVVSLHGDTIDALCWRHLGETAGVVERTLQLNPHVVRFGAVLPRGTVVVLPRSEASRPSKRMVKLWD